MVRASVPPVVDMELGFTEELRDVVVVKRVVDGVAGASWLDQSSSLQQL